MAGTGIIRLTGEERRQLQVFAKSKTAKPRARIRAMIVLLSDAGDGGEAIAKVLGITRRSVSKTRQRWRTCSYNGLEDEQRPGRPPRADAAYIRLMLDVVQKDPRQLGYVYTRWTSPRLAEYLRRKTGVQISAGWLSMLLRMHGFVWRKTKRTIRNLQNPAATERAKRQLRRLKKGLCTETPLMNCGTPTESDSTSSR